MSITPRISPTCCNAPGPTSGPAAVYGNAEIIEFCSASLSRKMREADPHNIVLCPFAISIYTLLDDKNGTWVAYRKPLGAAAKLVEPLLSEIAAEAAR